MAHRNTFLSDHLRLLPQSLAIQRNVVLKFRRPKSGHLASPPHSLGRTVVCESMRPTSRNQLVLAIVSSLRCGKNTHWQQPSCARFYVSRGVFAMLRSREIYRIRCSAFATRARENDHPSASICDSHIFFCASCGRPMLTTSHVLVVPSPWMPEMSRRSSCASGNTDPSKMASEQPFACHPGKP
jgi:hypothetical protein